MFGKKKPKPMQYDPTQQKPVLHKSICTGETTAGFRERTGNHTYREVMLIRTDRDLADFMEQYGIETVPDTEY